MLAADTFSFSISFTLNKELKTCTAEITRNSSGNEIENVNYFYDDIVHVLQNTIDSCINSATDRRGGCGGTYVYQIQ